MKNYYVICIEDCPECNGNGFIRNPEWDEFWEKYRTQIEEAERLPSPTATNKVLGELFIEHWGSINSRQKRKPVANAKAVDASNTKCH